MNKRIYLTILILILICSVFVIVGTTLARYKTDGQVKSLLNYANPIFNVELMDGSEFSGDSFGYTKDSYHLKETEFPAVPGYPNLFIYYKVSNYDENGVNEVGMDYYLKLVKDEYSDDLPYILEKVVLVDEDGTEIEEVTYDEEKGIGPFFLPINEEKDFIYKFVMKWPKEDNDISHIGEQYGFHIEAEAVQHT